MNHFRVPVRAGVACAGLLLTFTGCMPVAQPRAFRTSFMPPAPLAGPSKSVPAEPNLAAPPKLETSRTSDLYSRSNARFLETAFPPQPSQADARMRRALERFEAGKQLYKTGDTEGAKREFDRAIDIVLSSTDAPSDRQSFDKKLDEMVETIYRFDVEGLGNGEGIREAKFDKSPLEDILNMTFPIDPKLKTKVKDQIAATTSQLPLEMNDAVLGFINFFASDRGRHTLIAGRKRFGQFAPLISRILDEEGVPKELVFLAQAESGFMPRAMSYMSAAGMWQFVKFRGQEYGLNQTQYTDERFDVEKATRAAARHLRDLYHQFGDWHLAIAAYNCGPGTVDSAIQRTGYADVWELRKRGTLPLETSNYVPIILAMTIMFKNAGAYGLEGIEMDPPLETDTVAMGSLTNLALISDAAGVPMSTIRDLNPALLRNMAPGGYQLKVPKGTTQAVVAGIEAVPADYRATWRLHKVAPGETLDVIAKRYGSSPKALTTANRQIEAVPEAGEFLLIPAAFTEAAPVTRRAVPARRAPVRYSAVRKPATTAARKPVASAAKSTPKPAAKPAAKPAQRATAKTPPARGKTGSRGNVG